ncbi:MAG TPA: PBP1A family penicillin-binding protein [Pyrinomonadaceae bacterium]|nr:PBP1A family penicillin-binding protein [Pyrinomonadaceae bacterium]
MLRSYRYYSRIVDARLARGYLTSRPGLYAAPAVIRPGQGLSADALVSKLRRAGYLEAPASDVWSGSFSRTGQNIQIRPTVGGGLISGPVLIAFDAKEQIAAITTDGVSLDSFTLEPEVLTNDVKAKLGERRALPYGEIPPVVVQAILATEDRRFFDHPGLDAFGLVRALMRNVVSERMAQGGSTITQQLVKNTYLSPERTFRRKYAEAMLAFALERRLSKEDIFALYCNEVYLGQRGALAIQGIEQAAHAYFGKEPKNLSLSEAATLAGMIQGPARYSPVRNGAAAEQRRNQVLQAMLREGFITSDQAVSATTEKVTPVTLHDPESLAPHFIDYVNHVAESQFEVSGEQQQIYTTIDLDLQKLAETALKRQLDRISNTGKNSDAKPQAALVALDPHTGYILAMIGGRDYGLSQLNRATDAHRQPGSTFKPFVYAAALEDGMSPVEMFKDAPREFVYDRNKIYRPANFGGSYSMKDVTMRAGLVHSLNTVTVDVALRTGLARTANLTERFGLPKPQKYPALALGTSLATPLELAAAYATFVNGGQRVEPKVIASISEPPSGATKASDVQSSQVISPTTAYMITNMLSAVIDHGTARAVRDVVKGTAIAGKTGTSRDGWFVGYTPNLVCAVWIGFDDNRQLGLSAAQSALPAWADFMNAAVARRPELGGKNFECPEGIKFVEIDADNGLISTLTCPSREFIAVTERRAPHMECYFHGNLPAPIDKDGPTMLNLPTAVATRRQSPQAALISFDPRVLWSTRVDVDNKGKRTLVNELR